MWQVLQTAASELGVSLNSQQLIPSMVCIELQTSASHDHSKVGFVMPLYSGSLGIDNVLPVRMEAAQALFLQLKTAVSFVHSAGLIHAGTSILFCSAAFTLVDIILFSSWSVPSCRREAWQLFPVLRRVHRAWRLWQLCSNWLGTL